jgi:hypothetical protein
LRAFPDILDPETNPARAFLEDQSIAPRRKTQGSDTRAKPAGSSQRWTFSRLKRLRDCKHRAACFLRSVLAIAMIEAGSYDDRVLAREEDQDASRQGGGLYALSGAALAWPSRVARVRPITPRVHGRVNRGSSVLLVCNGSTVRCLALPRSAGPYSCAQRPLDGGTINVKW